MRPRKYLVLMLPIFQKSFDIAAGISMNISSKGRSHQTNRPDNFVCQPEEDDMDKRKSLLPNSNRKT
ncbi:hypothetical protein BMS3Abin09_00491 [bacterium BMS3Abin09]|nr:hypothetical protein BMS3Abin09_00491 [bacterium BMS3Abin09]